MGFSGDKVLLDKIEDDKGGGKISSSFNIMKISAPIFQISKGFSPAKMLFFHIGSSISLSQSFDLSNLDAIFCYIGMM